MKEILNNKIIRIILFAILFVLIILLISFLFLKLWPPFGGTPSKSDKKDYAKRSTNYKNSKFHNEHEFQMIYNKFEKNKYVSTKGETPTEKIPTAIPNISERLDIDKLNFTWLGHSSLLMQMHGMNILIDPVFSNRTSPVSFIGPSRYSDLPIKASELPNIDIVVISHDHYDHLDYNTIKEIDSKVELYIVPLGVENHLERWGVDSNKIINMAWWEEININGLMIACTPARHYSSRNMIFDRFNTLWSSWVFIDRYHKVYESGDSGFDTHFDDIHNKYGDFDLAFVESGQYNNRWKDIHMTPEESVEAGKMLGAKYIMPIHWGAYVLSEHPWDDSVSRFIIKAKEEHIQYVTPMIGETIQYTDNMNAKNWWEGIE